MRPSLLADLDDALRQANTGNEVKVINLDKSNMTQLIAIKLVVNQAYDNMVLRKK